MSKHFKTQAPELKPEPALHDRNRGRINLSLGGYGFAEFG